jgi:hypothetical protein
VKTGTRKQLTPELEHYERVRELLIGIRDECKLPLTTVERALYRLTQRLASAPKRTWDAYRNELLVKAKAPVVEVRNDSGSGDDEQDKLPEAP